MSKDEEFINGLVIKLEQDMEETGLPSYQTNYWLVNDDIRKMVERKLGLQKISKNVTELIENYRLNLFTPDCLLYQSKEKCLSYYIERGDIEKVSEFLKDGTISPLSDIFFKAVGRSNIEMLIYLIKLFPGGNYLHRELEISLDSAIKHKNWDMIKYLISPRFGIYREKLLSDALSIAISSQNEEMIEFLLPYCTNRILINMLKECIYSNNINLLDFILNKQRISYEFNPESFADNVIDAAIYGNLEALDLMLDFTLQNHHQIGFVSNLLFPRIRMKNIKAEMLQSLLRFPHNKNTTLSLMEKAANIDQVMVLLDDLKNMNEEITADELLNVINSPLGGSIYERNLKFMVDIIEKLGQESEKIRKELVITAFNLAATIIGNKKAVVWLLNNYTDILLDKDILYNVVEKWNRSTVKILLNAYVYLESKNHKPLFNILYDDIYGVDFNREMELDDAIEFATEYNDTKLLKLLNKFKLNV